MLDKIEIGKRLREARLEKGYTQQAVVKAAGIGTVYLGEIERGLKMPSLSSFVKIIEALEVSADYVLRDEVSTGQAYIYDDLTQRLKVLTPRQRKGAVEILDAYLRNLE